jgi:RHS repeat-associated protein
LDAAGNPKADPNLGDKGNTISFTGRKLDPETGLLYYRYRYYDNQLGRFIGRDPIGYKGGKNLYEYVGSGPVNWFDPWGLLTCKDPEWHSEPKGSDNPERYWGKSRHGYWHDWSLDADSSGSEKPSEIDIQGELRINYAPFVKRWGMGIRLLSTYGMDQYLLKKSYHVVSIKCYANEKEDRCEPVPVPTDDSSTISSADGLFITYTMSTTMQGNHDIVNIKYNLLYSYEEPFKVNKVGGDYVEVAPSSGKESWDWRRSAAVICKKDENNDDGKNPEKKNPPAGTKP